MGRNYPSRDLGRWRTKGRAFVTVVGRDPRVPGPRACTEPAGPTAGALPDGVDPAAAAEFLAQLHAETGRPVQRRLQEVLDEIDRTGSYTHTTDELTFGARVAWRN